MIPLRDDNPTSITPFVTYVFIAACVLVFLWQMSLGEKGFEAAVLALGVIPATLLGDARLPLELYLVPPVATVFSSMFLHGGFMHLAGNMLYLWIFGNNVEDTLGHGRFVLFYVMSGAAAAAAQTALSTASSVPMIGASGAVSGVLGAYLLLFPRANVLTLIVFGFFVRLVRIPAVLVLGLWFLVQFLSGLATWGGAVSRGEAVGGETAWFAHLGGFLAGMLLLFARRPRNPWDRGPSRSW